MSFKILAVSALVAFCFLTSIASPVDIRADDELVKVPGGFLPKSNVHIVPDGGKIIHTSDTVQLVDASGKILHSSQLKSSRSAFTRPSTSAISSSKTRRDLASAAVDALFETSLSIDDFSAIWTIPPLPQKSSGQLLQYFIALGPSSLDSLVFPVLQYGSSAAGGGAFWSLSTWFITGDQAFATNVTGPGVIAPGNPVNPFVVNEDEFLGSPGVHAWFAGFEGFTPTTGLNIQTAEVFNVVVVSLEVTGATSLADLPDETTNLEDVSLETTADTFPSSLPWQIDSDSVDGITISVPSAAGIEGHLQISYAGELF